MKLCRYQDGSSVRVGFFRDQYLIDVASLLRELGRAEQAEVVLRQEDLIPFLPPVGSLWEWLEGLHEAIESAFAAATPGLVKHLPEVELLPPIARPPKLLLLAGNYIEHVKEQGDVAAERERTFPYVFMKPPSTTLQGSGGTFRIPYLSPNKIDYELELAVVVGKTASKVSAEEALQYVAGYTVINDISDRGFRPMPWRTERPRDKFFDWMHGKWHQGSCPCGPCLVTADEIPDPQKLEMQLTIDGEVRQAASTDQQVFSVAEVIAFISSFLTLEPGDIISTGTPAGVGNATGNFLKSGQRVEARIERIGTLVTLIA